jgi:hypothetical protein
MLFANMTRILRGSFAQTVANELMMEHIALPREAVWKAKGLNPKAS